MEVSQQKALLSGLRVTILSLLVTTLGALYSLRSFELSKIPGVLRKGSVLPTYLLHHNGSASLSLILQQCWGQGSWMHLNSEQAVMKQSSYARGPSPAAAMDNWTWAVPLSPNCTSMGYRIFDRRALCTLLRGRNILLIGDSITGQFRESLINLLWLENTNQKEMSFPYEEPIISRGAVCDGAVRIDHLLNWALGHVMVKAAIPYNQRNITSRCRTKKDCPHVSVTRGSPQDRVWGVDEFVSAYAAPQDIIVLNSGAHYQPDSVLLPQVRAALTEIRRLRPTGVIIWRNTPTGHNNCSTSTRPMTQAELALAKTAAGPSYKYPWIDFSRQNALILDLIKAEFSDVIYLDVATSTDFRGDLHQSFFDEPPSDRDCLHYHARSPNPIDNWVRMFYNVLYELSSLP